MKRNTGFIESKPNPTDFMVGAISGIEYKALTDGDWEKWLPKEELQLQSIENVFDTMSCVSFSASNCEEIQVNRMLANNEIPKETLDWLWQQGYLDTDGRLNLSDRYLAKMSGTTKQGNNLQKVADTRRHYGAVPEKDWPMVGKTWEEYMSPIPQALIDKGIKYAEIMECQYEWVNAGTDLPSPSLIQAQLKQSPLQIATAVCNGWGGSAPVSACDLAVSHATTLYDYDTNYDIFDHYNPFEKQLAVDYRIPYIFKYVITVKKNPMLIFQLENNPTLYFPVGAVLVPFSTDYQSFLKDFSEAVIVKLSQTEFAKFKISSLKVTK